MRPSGIIPGCGGMTTSPMTDTAPRDDGDPMFGSLMSASGDGPLLGVPPEAASLFFFSPEPRCDSSSSSKTGEMSR